MFVQLRVTEVVVVLVALKPVGAVGALDPKIVTLLEGADAAPFPAAFCAVTVNV